MGIGNVGLEKPIFSIAIGNAYLSKNVSVYVPVKILVLSHSDQESGPTFGPIDHVAHADIR